MNDQVLLVIHIKKLSSHPRIGGKLGNTEGFNWNPVDKPFAV